MFHQLELRTAGTWYSCFTASRERSRSRRAPASASRPRARSRRTGSWARRASAMQVASDSIRRDGRVRRRAVGVVARRPCLACRSSGRSHRSDRQRPVGRPRTPLAAGPAPRQRLVASTSSARRFRSSTTAGSRSVVVSPSSWPSAMSLQQPAHDLARARLRQVVGDDHGLRAGDLADLLRRSTRAARPPARRSARSPPAGARSRAASGP